MYEFLKNLDRRWIFLLMLLAVSLPILGRCSFPEKISPMVHDVFAAIEELPEGSKVLLSFDYDPGSQGELQPMASAFTRHCAEKKFKMYFLCLWPLGEPMIEKSTNLLKKEYPDMKYGEDFVSFGFKAGGEGVIKVIVTNMRELIPTDQFGTGLDNIPMTRDIKNIQQMDLIINVSAGDPGTKQWVQFASTPYDLLTVSGCTGVQAPLLYPYIPKQLRGLLGAIKGAAEYEQAIDEHYPKIAAMPEAQEAKQRMGAQLVAHVLMVILIIVGNIVYFVGRKRGDVR